MEDRGTQRAAQTSGASAVHSGSESPNTPGIVVFVLIVLVLVGVGGYKFVTTDVLHYSKKAWVLWALLSAAILQA